jgi:hypothetical protein
VHTIGGVVAHAGYPVLVAVKSNGYAGVPQKMLNQLSDERPNSHCLSIAFPGGG